MKTVVVFLVFEIIFKCTFAKDYSSSLAQANIYYQRPIRLGNSKEVPMLDVEMFSERTNIKLIIHGYLGNRGHSAIVPVRNGTDNIFMADWERAASHGYPTSRGLVLEVAMRFAKIVSEFMKKNEIDPNEMHLIGHSLGAHIVGNIGRYFNGTFGRITGLDPALPLFVPQSADGLRPDDAKFVDVIHTDHPVFGDITPRGKADFYPNYGRAPQPGCTNEDLRTLTSCSHYRAVQLYAESIGIPRNFPAFSCSLPEIVLNNVEKCRREATFNTTVMMGEYIEQTRAIGQYFLITNAAPPFGLGDNSEIYRNLNYVQEPPPLK
ncbi:pancreatic triacylglycerol lipase isoform X2 [Eupeodes corollae]|uniref:pancreatic triacylglycerol lipase isoform X2 n=1 Tax=Eupeodes corollae TaxID=290404 RepID=UPI00249356E7|nr:pancreatic triacylglycerol lipase isoform X2 [Eupeodes corollae]